MKEKLLELMKNAYCPFTNFPVSSIVVTKDNKEFKGVNIEDASTRAGACAERVAIFSCITAGYKKGDIKEINIMTHGEVSTPCFVCRQMLLEFCENDTVVNCYNTDGEMKSYTIKELCPYPFDGDDLK